MTKILLLQLYNTEVAVLLLALCIVSGYRQLKNLQTLFPWAQSSSLYTSTHTFAFA